MSYATSVIKNIQTGATAIGAASTSATATITSVDTTKAVASLRIAAAYGATPGGDAPWTVTLTDATTITVTKAHNNNAATVPWNCVEYF